MSPTDALIILQCRTARRSLPGRSGAIAGASVFARCLARLLAGRAAPVVVSASDRPEDDDREDEAWALGVPTFRSRQAGELARLAELTGALGPTYVIHGLASSPAVDVDAPARVLGHLRRGGVDYVIERGLPVGGGVVGMRAEALRRLADQWPGGLEADVAGWAASAGPELLVLEPLAPSSVRAPHLRLTVETADDFAFMEQVLRQAGGHAIGQPLSGIIRAAERVLGRPQVA